MLPAPQSEPDTRAVGVHRPTPKWPLPPGPERHCSPVEAVSLRIEQLVVTHPKLLQAAKVGGHAHGSGTLPHVGGAEPKSGSLAAIHVAVGIASRSLSLVASPRSMSVQPARNPSGMAWRMR